MVPAARAERTGRTARAGPSEGPGSADRAGVAGAPDGVNSAGASHLGTAGHTEPEPGLRSVHVDASAAAVAATFAHYEDPAPCAHPVIGTATSSSAESPQRSSRWYGIPRAAGRSVRLPLSVIQTGTSMMTRVAT